MRKWRSLKVITEYLNNKLLLSLLFTTFMQTIHIYIPETNHASRVYVLLPF